MKRILLSTLIVFLALAACGQVPNAGFEEVTAFPSTTGQWNLTSNWTNAGSDVASPDLYHASGTLGGDLPETPIALVDPLAGNAIMGFSACATPGTNRREYLSVELESPLIPGEKYLVSFYYCNGYITEGSTAGLGVSDIGVCFTTDAPQQTGVQPLYLEPQFKRQAPLYSREWKNYTFSFYPDQAYTHMTIGVFGEDAGKQIEVFENSTPQLAYYFVDEFSIKLFESDNELEAAANTKEEGSQRSVDETDELYEPSPFFIPNAFTPNGDGENDVFAPVVNDLSNYEFCIFSRWGELIFKTTTLEEGWDGHSMNGVLVDVGMYVWELSYTQYTDEGQSVDKRHRGTVNLIR